MTERQKYFTECEYPDCRCPRYGRCGNAIKDDMINREIEDKPPAFKPIKGCNCLMCLAETPR